MEKRKVGVDQAGVSTVRGTVDATSAAPPESDELSGVSQLTDVLASVVEEEPDLRPGDRLGDCTITRLIAEGGMGRVYEARQHAPKRDVAVKLIRSERLSAGGIRRFTYEAELLGQLQHPAIASIYAAGVEKHNSGVVPFFVMELVSGGQPITDFASKQRLSKVALTRLFLTVCEGVSYAHRRGVIHRDLKPRNIIVGDDGQPKVIDFGVARITGSEIAILANGTATGAFVGTLQAMSPEQVTGDSDLVGTPSDVYALGLVLYELLAGKPPYRVPRDSVVEAARIIQTHNPPSLLSLRRGVDRDLSLIVATCLRKQAADRYQTAGEIADDLRRYLQGQPLRARELTTLELVRYWGRRHRVAAVAAFFVGMCCVVAAIGISLFAVRAERARDAAVAERNRVAGMLDFFLNVFEQADPEQQGVTTQLRDVLQPAVRTAENSFYGDPISKARVLITLASCLRSLGDFDAAAEAIALAEQAVKSSVGTGSEAVPLMPLSILVERARLASDKGDYRATQTLAEEALRKAGDLSPGRDLVGDALGLLARAKFAFGEKRQAEGLLRESLAVGGPAAQETADYARRQILLADVLFSTQARFGEAEEILEGVIVETEQRHGENHPRVAFALQQLAHMKMAKERSLHKAEPLLQRAVLIVEEAYGPQHPQTATALAKVAGYYVRVDRFAEARPLIDRSVAIREERLGPSHVSTARGYMLLADWYAAQGNIEAAAPLQEKGCRVLRESYGLKNAFSQNEHVTLAGYRSDLGDIAGAEEMYEDVWNVLQPSLGTAENQTVANIQAVCLLWGWVDMLLDEGQMAAAESRARESLKIAETLFNEKHPIWKFRGRIPIINVLLASQRVAEARLIANSFEEIFRNTDPNHPEWKRREEIERRIREAEKEGSAL